MCGSDEYEKGWQAIATWALFKRRKKVKKKKNTWKWFLKCFLRFYYYFSSNTKRTSFDFNFSSHVTHSRCLLMVFDSYEMIDDIKLHFLFLNFVFQSKEIYIQIKNWKRKKQILLKSDPEAIKWTCNCITRFIILFCKWKHYFLLIYRSLHFILYIFSRIVIKMKKEWKKEKKKRNFLLRAAKIKQ